ncbi:MAG: glycoside hydrolase family 16 protein [Ferruginibacter sp.]|nr:glycoside hydrolase family 16 protein [Ferruginibacter sp.]
MNKNVFFNIAFAISSTLLFFSCGKDKAPAPSPLPAGATVSVQNASVVRLTTATTIRFYISSNVTSTGNIAVDYNLTDGNAHSPLNYTTASGTITIPSGQSFATVDVAVAGDAANNREPNLEFNINLSNAKNCTISTPLATGTIKCEDGLNLTTSNVGYTTPTTYAGKTLVWADEFNGTTLNLTDWNQETGNNNGWGNNELEYYTNSTKNTFVSNGNLIIEARKELIGGFNYSSGRMTTQNKKVFTFGRIDIRAKLPVSKGMWPALWMLGSNISSVSWPQCGEIDIMELVGTNPNRVHSTMHWKNAGGTHSSNGSNYTLPSGNFSDQFHVFSLVWSNNSLLTYVDDILYATTTNVNVSPATYPFNANQFFLFNVAVGGDWPGSPDATTLFPSRMFVDYVRVFQ